MQRLSLFVPHCSDLFTDHRPHGDGLIAYGFLSRLAARGHHLTIVASRAELNSALPANVRLIEIDHEGRLSRLQYMQRVRRLFFRLHREAPFDLIHQLNPVFSGISLALFGASIPVVLGTYVSRWPSEGTPTGWKKIRQRAASALRAAIDAVQQWHADSILLTGPAAESRIPAACFAEGKIFHLNHGVDENHFAPAQDVEVTPFSILYVATLVRRKGIFDLLRAFQTVRTRFPQSTMQIAGSGPDEDEVRQTIKALGLGAHVQMLGRVDRTALPALYNRSSIYCLPSHGEPYATAILEAMSCGRPIVYSKAGGLPNMVQQGGLGFKPANAAALANALCSLLERPELARQMGERNRQKVLSSMTWDRVVRSLEEVYRTTIEQHGKARLNPAATRAAVTD